MHLEGFGKFQCHRDVSYGMYMGLLLLGTASALTKQLDLHLPPEKQLPSIQGTLNTFHHPPSL